MDNFLDTCIIITRYDNKDTNYEKICIFLEELNNIIISVYQEQEEIPKLFNRKKKMIRESISFNLNRTHVVDFSDLSDREVITLKKLITRINLNQETEENLKNMLREMILLERKVLGFIQNKVTRKVIPVCDIKEELVNEIKRLNQNKADAHIIASAIQEHQKNKLIAFTLDKKDWKINEIRDKIEGLNFKCPEIRFLR